MSEELRHLQRVARNLYFAAKWSTDSLPGDEQRQLWEELRDAAHIPIGSATKARVAHSELSQEQRTLLAETD